MKAKITLYDRDKRSNNRKILMGDIREIDDIEILTKAGGNEEMIENLEANRKTLFNLDDNHMYWKVFTPFGTAIFNFTTTDIFVIEE